VAETDHGEPSGRTGVPPPASSVPTRQQEADTTGGSAGGGADARVADMGTEDLQGTAWTAVQALFRPETSAGRRGCGL